MELKAYSPLPCIVCGELIELGDLEGAVDGYIGLYEDVNDLLPLRVVHAKCEDKMHEVCENCSHIDTEASCFDDSCPLILLMLSSKTFE